MEDIRFVLAESQIERRQVKVSCYHLYPGCSIEFENDNIELLNGFGMIEEIDVANRILKGKRWIPADSLYYCDPETAFDEGAIEFFQSHQQFEVVFDQLVRFVKISHKLEFEGENGYFFQQHISHTGEIFDVKSYSTTKR